MERVIGIVGAGAMGAGIAQVAAQHGAQVIVCDDKAAALDRGRGLMAASLGDLLRRGRLDAAGLAAVEGRLSWHQGLAALAGADVVIEAIVEDMAAKQGLFAALEAVVGPDCILATNTSSLSVSGLAGPLARPGRFAGLHFFNPVPAMKLVEVVRGRATGAEVAARLSALVAAWGKLPVEVRDVPGFIVNRVARPFYAEAFVALGEGQVDAVTIDRVLQDCGGFRLGPLALADIIGHDVNYAAACGIHAAYDGRTRFRPQAAQARLVETGALGRKAGRGVYDDAAPKPAIETLAPAPVHEIRRGEARLTAALPVDGGEADGVLLLAGDGRSAATMERVLGRPVVLFDFCRDPAAAPLLALAGSPGATAAMLAKAAGFAAAQGKQAVRIPDRPGLLSLRTWAQLYNAAADAVADRVASAADVDLALRYGTNYPEGPLALAARLGLGFVTRALGHIADETGDEFYRPSAAL
ncbi:3-hydroxyacyl-CoA dehydrogenase NAD-binding domain-containing protein [Zavarzinia compransoris]|uniref:3-hydroxyacyl-CoA dehydrogenase n=1 Tax=Zavarzinia compransoris TaxID=1264899 RepID=A0A317E0I2_9PROT|nr:3-hydroxyacyl-CoA dehydrogenase NAD-binding domain-containing protein [Zavarzinia compransoris]PWR18665.1 3-hydroxyacyl-CoA dehydrogenase [Zavarzinia compransoris]TDP40090.1 3-hydroxyacyl-CoA dehydrogenase [Zavarzinia compransoris]